MAPTVETANRLIHERSPYLRQHAHNPVDWYPWGPEAFARARQEDKPVFVSLGYSTCHWCHVMAHESFEDPATAAVLNEHFISIKVDREERPEIDDLYMTATQLTTGRGGWPNSVFLTPAGKPWYAGTYFPPEDRGGLPGFRKLLAALVEAWRTRRPDVLEQADKLAEAVREARSRPAEPAAGEIGPDLVESAVAALRQAYDAHRGGFGDAPKFPPHSALRLLFERHRRGGDGPALDMATRTLNAIAAGGIHDHVGGGFHRYSTDERWFVPHFEKMLYDNAQLIRAYTDGFLATGNEEYGRAARAACEWVMREMIDPAGGFCSALDADSEGQEGRFYLWRRDEIIEALGSDEGELFCRVYDVTADGNYPDEATGRTTGWNILHLARSIEISAKLEEMPPAQLRARMERCCQKLLAVRNGRVRPGQDDKILADWNGLMIGALAYAGRHLGEPRYIQAAERAATFVLNSMCRVVEGEQKPPPSKQRLGVPPRPIGRLAHVWRPEGGAVPGYLDDYAFLADGLLELHEATGQEAWLDAAGGLTAILDQHYRDEAGGYFFTADDAEELLGRTKSPYDAATPSGNGVIARVLVRLAEKTGDSQYLDRAKACLEAFAGYMRQAPRATETLIASAAMYLDAV